MSARDELIKYTASCFTEFGRRVIAGHLDAFAAEVRAATLREAADYADRKADKYEDYSAVAAQAAYGIADGLRDMAEEEK